MNSDASADQPPPLPLRIGGVAEPWKPLKRSANASAVLKMHNQSVGTEIDGLSARFTNDENIDPKPSRTSHGVLIRAHEADAAATAQVP
jgi:hypothetical protein